MTDQVAHLRGPVKGLSSYDKICSHLLYTQEFVDFEARVFKTLTSAHVCGWEFEPGGSEYASNPEEKKHVPPPKWRLHIDWGTNLDGSPNIEKVYGPSNIDDWNVSLETAVKTDALEKFAEDLFDTPKCPTYFCKLDKLLGYKTSKKGERERSGDNIWAKKARERLQDSLGREIARVQEKLRGQMVEAIRSERFQQEMTEYHERGIADEIKAVLIKFKDVAKPHVLKMAMDEFVCHEIMDS